MEWKDIVTGVSLILVVAGWIFTRWKDRNHEIFKERLKKRLDMYDSLVAAILPFLNPGPDGAVSASSSSLAEMLGAARTKIQLYGYSDEISEYESFLSYLTARNLAEVNHSLKRLSTMITKKLRKELGY
ncbi:MAG: hypothetical protein ABSC76_13895 [Terracidiphilus sp.]|jgi:hypothetical protein